MVFWIGEFATGKLRRTILKREPVGEPIFRLRCLNADTVSVIHCVLECASFGKYEALGSYSKGW